MTWDWQVFLQDPGGKDPTYWQWMLSAWGWTLSVALLALAIALVVGSLMGILRTAPNKWLMLLGNTWTEVFRNIPLLVQIILWYHVIPSMFTSLQQVPSFLLVVVALGFFTSARVSEQVKAGIQSLPRGQRYAGLAVGFTLPQTYRYVLLPMAFRIVLPPLTSETHEHLQELVRGVCRVGGRTHHVRHAGAGRNLARHRGLSGGDQRFMSSRRLPSTG